MPTGPGDLLRDTAWPVMPDTTLLPSHWGVACSGALRAKGHGERGQTRQLKGHGPKLRPGERGQTRRLKGHGPEAETRGERPDTPANLQLLLRESNCTIKLLNGKL